MVTKKFQFKDVVICKEGLLKGPFGSDLKKSLYVPKSDTTYKVYLQENILKQDNTKGSYYITEDYYNTKMKRYLVSEGDFIVTCDGTLGEIYQLNNITEKGIISSSLLRITLNKQLVDETFFPYFWKMRMKDPLINSHDNSVLKHLPGLQVIREFEIDLPELKNQKNIGRMLNSIDKKIELNNKINKELEYMAKTLYDYWFVQFDFPNKNGKPYKSSGGKMVYNKELKREIPKNWKVSNLSDIANITMGQSPAGYTYNEEENGTVFFQGSTNFGWRFPTVKKYTTEPTRFAKEGDILLSVRAPVGTLNIADNDCCIGRGLSSLNSKDGVQSFLYYVMVYFKKIFDLRNESGTTFGSITKDDLYTLKLTYPNLELVKKYDDIVSGYNAKILNNYKENQKLIQLRDWLLPMLMNGQVKVK